MEDILVVEEKYSRYWKIVFYGTSVTSVLAFLAFWNLENIIWTGILRLVSFISFAIAMFCLLKIMEGQKNFKLTITEKELKVAYLKNNQVIRKETFPLEEIASIKREPASYSFPIIPSKWSPKNTFVYRIDIKNSDRKQPLFQFGGRVLPVDGHTGDSIETFFRRNIDSQIFKTL